MLCYIDSPGKKKPENEKEGRYHAACPLSISLSIYN